MIADGLHAVRRGVVKTQVSEGVLAYSGRGLLIPVEKVRVWDRFSVRLSGSRFAV